MLYSVERLHGAASRGYGSDCCPPVVDPYTLLALLAGIALATYFLRVALIAMGMGNNGNNGNNGNGGGRRRELRLSDVTHHTSRQHRYSLMPVGDVIILSGLSKEEGITEYFHYSSKPVYDEAQ
jgi:hypothetical protein